MTPAYHSAFQAALGGDESALRPYLAGSDDRALAGLAVYRNTAIKGRIDALQANFPTVARMVGTEWFRAAARLFVEAYPGGDPVLLDYGAGFPDWLARFEPALEMPYLAPCARLDRAWTEAHLAADAVPMTRADLMTFGPAAAGHRARLIPSARLFWFDWNVPTLWLAHRGPDSGQDHVWSPDPEGLLIHRPGAGVRHRRLSRPQWAVLDACRKGRPLAVAAAAADGPRPRSNPSALLVELIDWGVIDAGSSRIP